MLLKCEKLSQVWQKPFSILHRENFPPSLFSPPSPPSTGINCCHPRNNRAQRCQLYLIDWVKHTQISQNNGHKNLYMTPPVKSSACLFHFHAAQQAVGPVLKRFLPLVSPPTHTHTHRHQLNCPLLQKVCNDSPGHCLKLLSNKRGLIYQLNFTYKNPASPGIAFCKKWNALRAGGGT